MGFVKGLFILSSVIGLLAVLASVFCPPAQLENCLDKFLGYLPQVINKKLSGLKTDLKGPRIFSKAELAEYNGEEGSPGLYLAILGEVFDVSKGARHYGPKGGYHFFTGKSIMHGYNCS